MARRALPVDFEDVSDEEGQMAVDSQEEGVEMFAPEEEEEAQEDDVVDEAEPALDGSRIDENGVLFVNGPSQISDLNTLKEQFQIRDIGHEAVWSLSTAKPGNGVDQIRDNNADTYWQSDGTYPHWINLQFCKRASVSSVALYLDYNLDESYTPKRLSVRAGMTHHDLAQVQVVDMTEPVGWIHIPLQPILDPLDPDDDASRRPLRAHLIQIAILSMHQNGRDTHIRQVKVFGPRGGGGCGGGGARRIRWTESKQEQLTPFSMPDFKSVELTQYATIR